MYRRALFPLVLFALACGGDDPASPPPDAQGVWKIHTIEYDNQYVEMRCPCEGDYRMTLADGQIRGDGAALIHARAKASGEQGKVWLLLGNGGDYVQDGDSVALRVTLDGQAVPWQSGDYEENGNTLRREYVSDIERLVVVWVRE